MGNIAIFPRPRDVTFSDAAPAGRAAPLTVRGDRSLPRQGYRLTARDGTLTLHHADEAGLRYGLDTVSQLRRGNGLDHAAVELVDWPDFITRGYMLDISRNRVPTRATLRELVGTLRRARYNQLELYTEHTFAYREHAVVWESASPITAVDIRWLDGLCAANGICLVANQNCLGHMERWLSHPEYADRAESPEGIDLVSEVLPATTLAPNEDNAAFVAELLDELVPLFRTHRINIGCDEPWELGRGASATAMASGGLGKVYTDYVRMVAEPWADQGYEVEYWADVISKDPEAARSLPAGCIPVVWMYNTPKAMQRLVDQQDAEEEAEHAAHDIVVRDLLGGFRDRAGSLIEHGIPFWVAPGTNAWRSITGRLDEAIGNLIDAAEVGIANKSEGYLVTHWGNTGHWDSPTIAVPAVALGGALSWCLDTNRDVTHPPVLAELLSREFFDDPSGALGDVLVSIGQITENLDAHILNTTPLWVVLHTGGQVKEKDRPSDGALEAARRDLLYALRRLEDARPGCAQSTAVIAETALAIDLALLGVDLLTAGVTAEDEPSPEDAERLLARLDQLVSRQVTAWLARARPGGLQESIAQVAALRARLERRRSEDKCLSDR